VLKATLDELGARGYTGMSMDGIAARAGVSKPAIYRRWPNKPALAIAALTMLVASEGPLSGDLVSDLANQLQWAHRNLEVSGGVPLIGTILAEMERHPGFIETYRETLLRPRRATLLALLEQGQRDGLIRSDVELDTATLVLLGSILIRDLAGEPFPDGWAIPVVKTILAGLAPDSDGEARA
jgi:AcrR family transcriptional regulator